MENCCDLEVDVNGQHIFWVNKKILAQYSSKLSHLFEKRCKNGSNDKKIIVQDFPGGPAGFEVITRFFYNNGIINITCSNVLFLNSVAKYMEMNKDVFRRPCLIDQTEKFLEGIEFWAWSDLLLSLIDGQRYLDNINKVSSVGKLIGEVVERLVSRCITTPSSSSLSSKCTSFRSSYDSKSTLSTKSGFFRVFWWFEDLSTLNIDLIDMLVRKMVLEKFEHITISKFLFYYQSVRVLCTSKKVVRVKIIEKIIDLLILLDKRSVSIKGLFETLRIASNLKLRKPYMSRLEILIGLQLDQATLDDLILPSPLKKMKKCTMYNVNLILRFLKNFLLDGNVSHKLCSYRLKKVARLVDLYASEIAPDSRLMPTKFAALVAVIPDSARDSCDNIYQAIEIYLEVHPGLDEEQKTKICAALNYNKLSTQVLNQLSRNTSFPLLAIVQAMVHQDPTLKSSANKDPNHLKILRSLGCRGHEAKTFMSTDEDLVKELAKNDKFRVHLQEIGWTVIELENIFGKLQNHYVTNVMTPKVCCMQNVKHLPKLCS